ncbi:MAG: VIT domain-containing protein [Nannocystaceae bacterium]|nr:hypothetical protein [Myxococcales bacterium]
MGRTRTRRGEGSGAAARRGLLAIAAVLALGCTGPVAKGPSAPDRFDDLAGATDGASSDNGVTIRQVQARRDTEPFSLTAIDGTRLALDRLEIRADLDEPLAFTEIELEFGNPEGRSLDAWLMVAIPKGARVTRFAVHDGGVWRDAEIVARHQPAFQRLVAEPREPALAHGGDDVFRARVFPVAAHEPTRVLVSYVHALDERRYRVPLAGLASELDELNVRIHGHRLVARDGPGFLTRLADGTRVYKEQRKDVIPGEDIVLEFKGTLGDGVRHEDMVVARLSPVPHDHSERITGFTVLFDTSASQAADFDRHVDRLGALIRAIDRTTPEDVPINVVAFDQETHPIYNGPIGKFGARELASLKRRGPLGASNLVRALRQVSSDVRPRGVDRLLVMTDGVITAGPSTTKSVVAEARRLKQSGYRRADVVTRGALAGVEALRAITGPRVLPEAGLVLASDTHADKVAHRLSRSVVDGIRVSIPGSDWVYPEVLDPIQAGDDVLVYARIRDQAQPERQGDDRVNVIIGGDHHYHQQLRLSLREGRRPLLESAWASARYELLATAYRGCVRDGGGLCDQWRERIESWSTSHRLLNEFTSMVMLAPGEDYARFGLDRASPHAVLGFGSNGAELRGRDAQDDEPTSAVAVASYHRPRTHALTPELRIRPEPWQRARRSSSGGEDTRSESPHETAWSVEAEPQRLPTRTAVREVVDAIAEGEGGEAPTEEPRARRKPAARVGRTPRIEDAYEGRYLTVMSYLDEWQDRHQALRIAGDWRDAEPDSVLALVALGEAHEANGSQKLAARAYGSLIDLYPGRADLRRYAGERLERLDASYNWLVLDSYARALELRAGDPTTYRLFAYALLRGGNFQEAFAAIVDGIAYAAYEERYRSALEVLRDDLSLIGAAWMARRPEDREYVRRALDVQGIAAPEGPSLRFVLSWETDSSDVDLHVRDGRGQHAYHRRATLESGGRLYQDVQEGHGIEAFVIDGVPTAYPYNVQVEYYATGPLGLGMGKLEIIEHDGAGGLLFDERPFIVSRERAYLDLGSVSGSLSDRVATRRGSERRGASGG